MSKRNNDDDAAGRLDVARVLEDAIRIAARRFAEDADSHDLAELLDIHRRMTQSAADIEARRRGAAS